MSDPRSTTPSDDEQPNVGTDPMRTPQKEAEKKNVAPDPDEVRRAERRNRDDETPEERAARIKNA